MFKFPFIQQPDSMACGATCIRMIAKFYGKNYSLTEIAEASGTTRQGVNVLGLSEASEKIGLRTLGVKVHFDRLLSQVPLPCIAHWNQDHFVVIYKIKKKKIYIADPAHGLLSFNKEDFTKSWVTGGKNEGVLLLLETTPEFYKDNAHSPNELNKKSRQAISFLFSYLKPHYKSLLQLVIGLLIGLIFQLIFPFLTQGIVDFGIQQKNIGFIYLMLFAQLMVFFGRTTVDIIRNYIFINVSSKINISLLSDFFAKLMKLPISFYDVKLTGDIMQRINDNKRIESFLTGSSLTTFFSLFNFIIFSVILAYYSLQIFFVFLIGSILYFFWITHFLKRRADLDYIRFSQASKNQSKVIELINGMQEIKLHNAERQKRWEFEGLQAKLFKIGLKGLSLTTVQNSGASLINELKNIIITFLAAKLVLDGKVTFGMMLSISYIIGQLNSPVLEMVNFIQRFQDAKLSLERLNEIHGREDEELQSEELSQVMGSNLPLKIKNMSFKYEGAGNDFVLKNITAIIPANKITAIVGSSGSGKTTLMKLLLKYYNATEGEITIDERNIKNISPKGWRNKFGVVMQEGYVFNDTIANNIAIGVEQVDKEKLLHAAKISNINEFIDSLPLGYNTKIGMEGLGISAGQKQRMLIARAVYKDPDYLFFDEATSALDANNEKIIMKNLTDYFKNKTVVVIAHRLSTVKSADQIIVLDKGLIIETGNHAELTAIRGSYFELVKNQLELGN